MAKQRPWEKDMRLERELALQLKNIRLKGLNELRNRAFTQANIARSGGFSASALYNWENGVCVPGTFQQWQAWARALGLVMDISISYQPKITPAKTPYK